MPLAGAPAWLAARTERSKGEFVLVLAPGTALAAQPGIDPENVLEILLEAVAPSEAARLAAKITGVPKNVLYRKTLKS